MPSDAQIIDDPALGRIEVRTLPLPEDCTEPHAHYLPSGAVFLVHKTPDSGPDDWAMSVVNDDGSDFRTVWSGPVRMRPKHNGIRTLPFPDGKRVMLGDHVLECEPSIEASERATLVEVVYPDVVENDPMVLHRWSEPIVAPDNEHVAWTTLHMTAGAYNVLARLRRQSDQNGDRYVCEASRLISGGAWLEPIPGEDGRSRPGVIRGGELKQFVRGGRAVSLAGSAGRTLVDSVVEDLGDESVTALTTTPGYDETTILSPDEQLGLVMTTRFSPATNSAVVGLLPRPYAAASAAGIAMAAYMYGVAAVRRGGTGNIGPALVELDKAATDSTYLGVNLSDPTGEWVYCSPMSWAPDSRRTMWRENRRGDTHLVRQRIATLLDRQGGEVPEVVQTPESASYTRALTAENIPSQGMPAEVRVDGAQGHVEFRRTGGEGLGQDTVTLTTYVGYSDDGRTFLDGTERLETKRGVGTTYEAHLQRTGDDPGAMDLRVTYVQDGERFDAPYTVSFEQASDGKPASYGHTTYGGQTLLVDDMAH